MHNYIYELFGEPVPADEWAEAWEYHEHPDTFLFADMVEDVKDRDKVIERFGRWLKKHRLGELSGESFTVDLNAADCYFQDQLEAFQRAASALQQLNAAQFIHEYDHVQELIGQLEDAFVPKRSDYVLWDEGLEPTPMDEFLRKAKPGARYYIGGVLDFKY